MTTPVFPVKSRKCRSEICEKEVEYSNPRPLQYEKTTELGGPEIFQNKPLKIRDRLLLVFTQQKIYMAKNLMVGCSLCTCRGWEGKMESCRGRIIPVALPTCQRLLRVSSLENLTYPPNSNPSLHPTNVSVP